MDIAHALRHEEQRCRFLSQQVAIIADKHEAAQRVCFVGCGVTGICLHPVCSCVSLLCHRTVQVAHREPSMHVVNLILASSGFGRTMQTIFSQLQTKGQVRTKVS